jgi:transposase-like protein
VSVPADLRRRFADFRRASAPRTRVPNDLRRAVLLAVDQGAEMTALRCELGVTAKQVEDWRRGASCAALDGESSSGCDGARVFDVADRPVVDERVGMASNGCEALELRLGTWSVVIRSTCP